MTRIHLPGYVSAKVRRAERHLQDLDDLLYGFAATEPVLAEAVFEPFPDGGGTWGAKLRIVGNVPDDVSLLVGDFLHNLRSSLDYLAQALVLTSGNQPKDGVGGTAFPVLKNPKQHGQLTVKGTVTAEIGLAIEAIQPYKAVEGGVEWHPLLLLHELSNTDKHRTLHLPLLATVEPVAMLVGHLEQMPVGMIQTTMKTFADGEWLFPPFAPFPRSTRVEVVAKLSPMIALEGAYRFEDGATVSLIDQLDFMLRSVRDNVIPSFREFFLDPWPEDMFTSDPVPGPLGIPARTVDQHMTAVDEMVQILASKYGSDRYLVMGVMEGVSA